MYSVSDPETQAFARKEHDSSPKRKVYVVLLGVQGFDCWKPTKIVD